MPRSLMTKLHTETQRECLKNVLKHISYYDGIQSNVNTG